MCACKYRVVIGLNSHALTLSSFNSHTPAFLAGVVWLYALCGLSTIWRVTQSTVTAIGSITASRRLLLGSMATGVR
ncbi:MAG: hypothetical protein [Podoviridae sp. ctQNx1]|nr:MAG: hypothetical protein [Podoviridae sp. ctQNx1]